MNDSDLTALLAGPQFDLTHAAKREYLLPALLAAAERSAAANPALAKYNREMGFAAGDLTDYDELPYLPVSVFKTHELATVPDTDIVRTLLSSATTGATPSRIPLDKATSRRQSFGLTAILQDQIGQKRRPFLVLDIPEINKPGSELGARGAAVRGIMPFADSVTYGLKRNGVGYDFDVPALREFFTTHVDREVLVFGFTYLVWTEVVQKMRALGISFDHERMTLLHSGGWKKLTDQQVDKDVFTTSVAEVFGCAPDRVRDFYGMVEQVGVVFVDCEAGHKHSPAFAEVAIRDFETLRQVGAGGAGLIQVMSLLPTSYPGYALLTEDVGEVLGYDDCPCGRRGMYFRFRQRVPRAEIRGCGDTVAVSKVREPAAGDTVVQPDELIPAEVVSDEVQQLAGATLPAAGRPDERFAALREALNRPTVLDDLPVTARVGLLADVARCLLNDELAEVEGVAFLSAWLQSGNLECVLETNFGQRRAALDEPVPDAASALLAVPRGVVGHWVAGNVPTLAIFSWALATLAGNRSIVRVSRESVSAAERLFAAVGRARFSWGSTALSGADLLARTSVLHFDSRHQQWNAALSRVCDARCVWGGRDAVDAVRGLPTTEFAEDLVFGPKFSLSVVDREALADPVGAEKLARDLARDVAVFEQAACSSPQILYLEGTLAEHESWLTTLHEALAKVQLQTPRRAVAQATATAIVRERAEYGLSPQRRVWSATGTEHTLLAAPGAELVDAVQGRTLYVRAVEDCRDILPLLSAKIQTIGMALGDGSARAEFARAAARRGVARCVPPGTMNHFETPWDGMLPLSRLVRWTRVPAAGEAS